MKILITGVTGFLGGATAALLLEDGLGRELHFLVRAKTLAEGVSRVQKSLRRFEPAPALLESIAPERIVLGDLADVGAFSGNPRLDEMTHVLNCAGVASFGEHPGIWPVNVTGTVAFAQRMARAPKLRRFLQVGTAMACGPGKESPILESRDFPDPAAHLVPYTASKAEAEQQLLRIPGLPLVVARPSIVVGHTRLGCAPSSSIFWVFRMVQDLGSFLFDIDDAIDVIPSDYCARALKFLLLRDTLGFDLYHVSAGVVSGASFREIDTVMARARGITPLGDTYRKITQADIPGLLPAFQERLGIQNRKLMSMAATLYGAFSSLDYLFDNTRLLNEGMPAPPALTTYADRCIQTTEGIPLLQLMMDDFK